MRVAIDTMFLRRTSAHTGTAVYLTNLLRECFNICETNPLDFEFHGFIGPYDHWDQTGPVSPFWRMHRARILGQRRIWFLGGMALRTAGVRPDLVFLPTGQHCLPASLAPVVTTILDAIPRRIPSLVGRGSSRLHVMTWLNAKLATKIITISEWSKRDLVEVYGL